MATVSYEMWVRRISSTGSVSIPLDELPAPLVEFRRELRRAARAEGVRVLTSAQYGRFLAWDPEHVVTMEELRAVMESTALSKPPAAE